MEPPCPPLPGVAPQGSDPHDTAGVQAPAHPQPTGGRDQWERYIHSYFLHFQKSSQSQVLIQPPPEPLECRKLIIFFENLLRTGERGLGKNRGKEEGSKTPLSPLGERVPDTPNPYPSASHANAAIPIHKSVCFQIAAQLKHFLQDECLGDRGSYPPILRWRGLHYPPRLFPPVCLISHPRLQ